MVEKIIDIIEPKTEASKVVGEVFYYFDQYYAHLLEANLDVNKVVNSIIIQAPGEKPVVLRDWVDDTYHKGLLMGLRMGLAVYEQGFSPASLLMYSLERAGAQIDEEDRELFDKASGIRRLVKGLKNPTE